MLEPGKLYRAKRVVGCSRILSSSFVLGNCYSFAGKYDVLPQGSIFTLLKKVGLYTDGMSLYQVLTGKGIEYIALSDDDEFCEAELV